MRNKNKDYLKKVFMRTIINYFRSLWCTHDFKYEETQYTKWGYDNEVIRAGPKVSRTCKKCGWHKSYWKY